MSKCQLSIHLLYRYALMCDCWKPIPDERPSFTVLASAFNGLIHESEYTVPVS